MTADDRSLPAELPGLTPGRIAVVYLVFGISWILLSDTLLWIWTANPIVWLGVETTKGIVFVVLSTTLIYWLTSRARRRHLATTDRLERRTRELSIFHRIVRHNLRNIATVIAGRTEAAREARPDDSHLLVVERKADRLSTLAEKASLLRGISSEEDDRRTETNLVELLDDLCESRRQGYPAATIELDGPDQFTTMVPRRLGFAIGELLENAVLHSGDDPTVSISLLPGDEQIRITVADDGPGLPNVERTAIEGGVEDVLDHSEGVGLWLARLIVESADGTLAVSDSHLDGAAVTISFPRVEPTRSPIPTPS